jgi:hypothetical protein
VRHPDRTTPEADGIEAAKTANVGAALSAMLAADEMRPEARDRTPCRFCTP